MITNPTGVVVLTTVVCMLGSGTLALATGKPTASALLFCGGVILATHAWNYRREWTGEA